MSTHCSGRDDGLGQDEAVDGLLADKPLLVGYARAIVGNRATAEDLFQDLLILVMRKHAEIPNREALPGWSRRALRFLALMALEKRARERPAMDAELVELIDATCIETAPSRAEAQLEALTLCRDRLPERSRRLLAMRDAGETLPDGRPCPARRAACFVVSASLPNLDPSGWNLLEGCIRWLSAWDPKP